MTFDFVDSCTKTQRYCLSNSVDWRLTVYYNYLFRYIICWLRLTGIKLQFFFSRLCRSSKSSVKSNFKAKNDLASGLWTLINRLVVEKSSTSDDECCDSSGYNCIRNLLLHNMVCEMIFLTICIDWNFNKNLLIHSIRQDASENNWILFHEAFQYSNPIWTG